ncbi:carbamoyl-phosphate synthase (glutamine-hydrolyzing) large subunit [Natranaerofaba carboxydovora]|uniref:carbamoyl-phosphate synthase (glutamine-hydrolyzing) large subunit n=1 Tax=Natranaerofaba carboxydovora TaxID=2742683 RepID=UPI003B847BE7|nr:Carbamoyl-phosphate synthase large chain [Natranaerofaba carboxydovora]
MPLNDIDKILLVGSGPIVIGQAAEFDYAGTQALKAIKEEGIEVVLVNSNPATIMTDLELCDKVYFEPLTPDFVEWVIEKERPDGFVPGLGGQTALNLAFQLSKNGVLEKYGVKLLGTSLISIEKAEDREEFKSAMNELNEPVPDSTVVKTAGEAVDFADKIGYPVIVRPAYTLGGSGGGNARNEEELIDIVKRGLNLSIIGEVLIEKSVKGWKEIEFEVMRDRKGNAIAICDMENFDPIGIHTGDSIVVAPNQTLTDKEYKILKDSALRIISGLEIEGGCNVQFALDKEGSGSYYVIEVNPRVSRSSALASKATGYPIAKVSTKIALGYGLDELDEDPDDESSYFSEPSLDYVVVKIPRWPFDKFEDAGRILGTQMKATGEVMSLDRTLEGAFLKALRSLEIDNIGFYLPEIEHFIDLQAIELVKLGDDRRLFGLAKALELGVAPEKLEELTEINMFFLETINNVVKTQKKLRETTLENVSEELLSKAKKYGMSDDEIAIVVNSTSDEVRNKRKEFDIYPSYRKVTIYGGDYGKDSPYFYSTYEGENQVESDDDEKVIVFGSGPIRIGQGIEFDYASVHCVWSLQKAGKKVIIVNNNPETVSTDFDCGDKLYFEPLGPEDAFDIIDKENPEGCVVQFGGQTAINLTRPLHKKGINILGTSPESIDKAEDREKCYSLLRSLNIPQAEGTTVTSKENALGASKKIGFPLLVRPSYVIGGRAMEIVRDEQELFDYLSLSTKVSDDYPLLMDSYLPGKEVEIDAISDGEDVLIPGIMEHVEEAGVHSGDSMAVYPPESLSDKAKHEIEDYTRKIARALNIKGIFNIQYIYYNDRVYVLEINPRASRTVPVIAKVTGIPAVDLAARCMLGEKISELGYGTGVYPEMNFTAVKAPVFSFEKLHKVDTSLGPEMKSTGEVLGIGEDFALALYKTLLASGNEFFEKGNVLFSVADEHKEEVIPLAEEFSKLGFKLYATQGTYDAIKDKGINNVEVVTKVGEGLPNVMNLLKDGEIDLVINTPTGSKSPDSAGFKLRRLSSELKITTLTSPDTAAAYLKALKYLVESGGKINVKSLGEYLED